MKKTDTTDGLIGLSIGNALGLPVKGKTRQHLEEEGVTSMIGYGMYNQPPGTWSEESSLAFCLTETLIKGYSPEDLLNTYSRWLYEAYFTPWGKTFLAHNTVKGALNRKEESVTEQIDPGALISLLPLAYWLEANRIPDYPNFIMEIGSLIHKQPEAKIGAVLYVQYAMNLINGQGLSRALENACRKVDELFNPREYEHALRAFRKLWNLPPLEEIPDDGSIGSFFAQGFRTLINNNSYRETVLTAVNLGGDTEALGAMTGGLAGIYYGQENIPPNWIEQLAKFDDIQELATGYNNYLYH